MNRATKRLGARTSRLLLSSTLFTCVCQAAWLYVAAFQSGAVQVWDTDRGAVVRTIEVDDKSGAVGLAVTSAGDRLFVADGGRNGRLSADGFDRGLEGVKFKRAVGNFAVLPKRFVA